MNQPPKNLRDSVGPTDVSPPSRRPYQSPIIKVVLKGHSAIITSKDGAVSERFPIEMVRKRFQPGETVGFFRAIIKSQIEALEIGERLPDQEW